MYITTSIRSDDDKYELFAFLEDGKYKCTSLCKGGVDDEDSWVWDNTLFLKNILIPILNGGKDDNGIANDIPLKDFPTVKALIDKGVELGFFKETDNG